MIGLFVFISSELLFGDFQYASTWSFFVNFAFYQIYAFVIGGCNMILFEYLNSRDWKGRNGLRAVTGVFSSFFVTLITLFLLRMGTAIWLNGESFKAFISYESDHIVNYVFGGAFTIIVVLIISFVYIYKANQEKKVQDSELVAKTVTAKFESLKSQLDPHFLFNSLNVLTSLIGEDPKRAEEFTTKLSKVYRYVLEQKNKDLIPLSEELRFAKAYMDLIQMRFEDQVGYELISDYDTIEDYKIVPLTLQLLLENCIKHNQLPLQIKVVIADQYISVENNFNPKQVIGKSTKVGLENISKRYGIISERAIEIIKNKKEFVVRIPLLIQEAKVMKTIDYSNHEKYLRAKNYVKELKEFYTGLISFCVVMPILIYVNYQTYWGFQWFWFAGFGWGIGIVIQAVKIYGVGTGWEDKQIKKYMDQNNY